MQIVNFPLKFVVCTFANLCAHHNIFMGRDLIPQNELRIKRTFI